MQKSACAVIADCRPGSGACRIGGYGAGFAGRWVSCWHAQPGHGPLGGKDNFVADQAVAGQVAAAYPDVLVEDRVPGGCA